MAEGGTPIVVDNGTGMIKLGYSGEEDPRSCFPSVVGRPKYGMAMVGLGNKDCYLGEEAIAKKGVLKLSYPMEHGLINNWDDMVKIWHHGLFNELKVTPS